MARFFFPETIVLYFRAEISLGSPANVQLFVFSRIFSFGKKNACAYFGSLITQKGNETAFALGHAATRTCGHQGVMQSSFLGDAYYQRFVGSPTRAGSYPIGEGLFPASVILACRSALLIE